MDSPLTSRLRFLDENGAQIPAPREWRRGLVALDIPIEDLPQTRLVRNGEPLPLVAKPDGVGLAVLAEWPLSGTGRYRLILEAGSYQETRDVIVVPEKISVEAYAQLIDDLQTALPASIALTLQRLGAFAGVRLRPPGETTLEQELYRLRRAVLGGDTSQGLSTTLPEIGRDPHRILIKTEHWVERGRARRIEPTGLVAAFRKASNVDVETRLPHQVPDVRVELTADVYENRLVRSYHDQVDIRLRRIKAAFQARNLLLVVLDVEGLERTLRRARLAASFLDEVKPPAHLPTKPTMVLLKRPYYRALLESYLEFRRTAFVELDEPNLETPLENLPHLYESWATLRVIDALLRVARELGYTADPPRLARHSDGGLYVKVLPDGQPAVELHHDPSGIRARLIPQRSYHPSSSPIRSISFGQTPDVTVEILRPGEQPALYLFDPKYKLDSETDAAPGDGKPKKVDIDKMHAYRDAIRGIDDRRAVRYAATLYPGPETRYGEMIEALSARPLEPDLLDERLQTVFVAALTSQA
jgi:predicted component of viral defense system (DUF524 family)